LVYTGKDAGTLRDSLSTHHNTHIKRHSARQRDGYAHTRTISTHTHTHTQTPAILIYIHSTAVMLQHIHGHDSPLCKKVREPYIKQKLAPVQDQHSNLCHPHHKPFLTTLSIEAFALHPCPHPPRTQTSTDTHCKRQQNFTALGLEYTTLIYFCWRA